jgi:hypothetical protein
MRFRRSHPTAFCAPDQMSRRQTDRDCGEAGSEEAPTIDSEV